MSEIYSNLIKVMPCIDMTQLIGTEPPIYNLIKSCCRKSTLILSSNFFLIQCCLERMHEKLNIGNWKEISINDRRSVTMLSFLKFLAYLEKNSIMSDDIINKAYEIIDNGLLFGAPLTKPHDDLLHQCANLLSQWKTNQKSTTEENGLKLNEAEVDCIINLKQNDQYICTDKGKNPESMSKEKIDKPVRLDNCDNYGMPLYAVSCPSIQAFYNNYFIPQNPVVILDCMNHWPALTLWSDTNYILNKAGHRTVPIELGSKYTDTDWTQKLMTIKEFIEENIYKSPPTIGYLAQHQLFNQIPELLDDIKEPEYCSIDLFNDEYCSLEDVDINAWFGPSGTISPLHFDRKHNILAQVVGEKLVILFCPEDAAYLYCHSDNMLQNTAQVDPTEPDIKKFPDFIKAKPYFYILKPGEMLYIPPKWWHYCKSLSVSFSVNFWWK